VKKIIFFVPPEHVSVVRNAMFLAGAGRVGNYECCSFETLGLGQFKPLEGSSAFLGKVGELEKLEELKVEMVCEKKFIHLVIKAMKESHPYETVAYEVYSIEQY
jgi:hypothetical protein